MQVCVRTKTDDNWSDYGDTCTLTLVSDCAFMKEYRETVNTTLKDLPKTLDVQARQILRFLSILRIISASLFMIIALQAYYLLS